MDWKTAALLVILASTLSLSLFFKRVSKDLIFFFGGAITLLIGITPAKAFMENLTDGTLLAILFSFIVISILKEFLFDRTLHVREWRDWIKHVPKDLWTCAFAGFFFQSALEQTPLPTNAAEFLIGLFGESPFLLVACLMLVIYFLALFFPALMVLLILFPFSLQTLELCIPFKDATIAALLANFFAVLLSSLDLRTREQIHLKIRLPLLIIFFLLCTFLIPQFLLTK
ncbi:MAG: hypothetical protein ACHQT8_05455 [Chlamydiales bacterium]